MSAVRTGASRLRWALALAVLASLLYAVAPSSLVGAQVSPVLPLEAVPQADCGPGSRPETGLQGQTPYAERQSGATTSDPAQCNLERVGAYAHGEGASWQFAWYDHCGYYGTLDTPGRLTEPGAVVVDVSDPADPVETAVLQTPAVNDPHESLKVNEARGLLAAVDLDGPYFDVYDVSEDCTQPELLASVAFPGTGGHEGEWSPDGRTYYSAPSSGRGNVNVFDVADPTNPTLLHTLPRAAHGLSISEDGTRAYLTSLATRMHGVNGIVIVDVSDIQARKPNPQTPVVGQIYWADGALAQHTIPVTIDGEPHLIAVDEAGRGAARIVDISDETRPVVVSTLKLEVHLPANEVHTWQEWGAQGIFVYDAHYCSVDRRDEPTIVACGYFESGVRVFDIRDAHAPREIAYFKPPAITDRPLPGSPHGGGTADRCTAQVRIVPPTVDARTGERRPAQLWTQCQDNELLVLQFTNGVWPFPDE